MLQPQYNSPYAQPYYSQPALEHGIKVSTFDSSPQGFDPLTAKAVALEKFGFPPRLDDPHHLARFKRVMSCLKTKQQGPIAAPFCRCAEGAAWGKFSLSPHFSHKN